MWHEFSVCGMRFGVCDMDLEYVAWIQGMRHGFRVCGTNLEYVARIQGMWHVFRECGMDLENVAWIQGELYDYCSESEPECRRAP